MENTNIGPFYFNTNPHLKNVLKKLSLLYTPKRIWIVVLTMKYISSFLFPLNTRATCSCCLEQFQTAELCKSFLCIIRFEKKSCPLSLLDLSIEETSYLLFTWKLIKQEDWTILFRLEFLLALALSASKQPSFIVWKVSWLNVNCTTPLYVAWNDDLKIFPVIIYRVVFAPWPSHRPRPEWDRPVPYTTGRPLHCSADVISINSHYTLILIENRKSSRRHSRFLLSLVSHWLS